MSKRVTLSLTDEQRTELNQLTRSGTLPARTLTRARVLLLADRSQGERRTNKAVAEAVGVHPVTVCLLLHQFDAGGLGATLHDKSRPGQAPKITGDIEAQLVALCCSDPPAGAARWTLRLLADKIVAQSSLDSLSHVAVGDRLKNALKLWQVQSWCLSKPSAKFVAKTEDVLEVYQRPYDPARPVVCLDEKSKELHATPQGALSAKPGRPRREDYEYERNGTRNLFL